MATRRGGKVGGLFRHPPFR